MLFSGKALRGETQGALLALLALVLGPSGLCGQQLNAKPVTFVGLDYAYQGPSTLPAGPTIFTFENHGKVRHEIVVARLRPGATLDSVLRETFPARLRLIQIIGVLIAEPGDKAVGRLLVDLAPGTYVLVCNFQDAPDKPRHTSLGMIASVEVTK